MKKLFHLLAIINCSPIKIGIALCLTLLIINCAKAQAPLSIPYQAVARDTAGNAIANQNISLQFSIHDGSAGGTIVYQETQSATTNFLGLFTINIGQGTLVTGTFATIDWGGGSKFIQVEMDATGGTNYIDMGTQQMLSVPYALHAATAATATSTTNFGGNLSGDVSGTQSATMVDKIKGIDVSATPPLMFQHLRFDGVSWTPGAVDLSTDVTGVLSIANGGTGSNDPNYARINLGAATRGANYDITSISYINFNQWQLQIGPHPFFSAELKLMQPSFNGSNGITLTAPDNLSNNVTYVLPQNPVAGQFLQTDAAGVMSWADPSSSLGSLAGDVSGTISATSVNKIRGVNVSATAPLSSMHLRFDGTSWRPGFVDLSTDVSGVLPISQGGTGTNYKNFVDLCCSQVVSGDKTFFGPLTSVQDMTINGVTAGKGYGSVSGNVVVGDNIFQTQSNTGYGNTVVGSYSMYNNSSGFENSALGSAALYSNTTGSENSAMGTNAMGSNSTGYQNSALGNGALYSNTTGSENSAMGADAIGSNSTGYQNSAFGYAALFSNSSGNFNTAIGNRADVSSGGLINATAIGAYAVVNASNKIQLGSPTVNAVSTNGVITSNGYIKAGGTSSQYLMADGSVSTLTSQPPSGAAGGDLSGSYPNPGVGFVGGVSAANVATGANLANDATDANAPNTIVKRDASGNFSVGTIFGNITNAVQAVAFTGNLVGDVSGTQSSTVVDKIKGVGVSSTAPTLYQHLRFNGTNWTPGFVDLYSDVSGVLPISQGGTGTTYQNYVDLCCSQVIGGDKSFGGSLTSSQDVTINGLKIGKGYGSGLGNVILGDHIYQTNANTGTGNTAIGSYSMSNNSTGFNNSALGIDALSGNTTGVSNSAVGVNALGSNTAGNYNAALGEQALVQSNGSNNTAVGYQSLGGNGAGNNNTAIGYQALTSGTFSNATAIGANAVVNASNKIQLGNSSVTAVNTSGTLTANGYIKSGGTSAQYLKADGSTSTLSATSPLVISVGANPIISLSAAILVANGGTGTSSLTGYVKGNGASAMTASTTIPGSDVTGSISGNAAGFTGTLSGDITGAQGTTAYNNVVPSTKGGAGSVNGLMKANGSGTVTAATASDIPSLSGSYIDLTTAQTASGNKTFNGVTTLSQDAFINGARAGKGGGSLASNAAFGVNTLTLNSTGTGNTAVGAQALAQNSTGTANTSVGYSTLASNFTGIQNTAMGYSALANSNSTGNTAYGYFALSFNTSGAGNTAIGSAADVASGALFNATAIGQNAIVDASNKIQLGSTNVTAVNTSGTMTANGYIKSGGTSAQFLMANGNTSTTIALGSQVTGTLPVANGGTNSVTALSGSSIMVSNGSAIVQGSAGTTNTVLHGNASGTPIYGAVALTTDVNGTLPIANGGTGSSTQNFVDLTNSQTVGGTKTFSVDGSFNSVSVGRGAGSINTNTKLGNVSLTANTTGSENTAVGYTSLSANTTGAANTAIGYSALSGNSTGAANTSIGAYTLGSSTGDFNTALGSNSLQLTTSGTKNTGIGAYALQANTTGATNTALGYQSLNNNTTGSSNTAIGFNSDVGATGLTNATAIGANAIVSQSNSLVLGSGANVGIGTSTPRFPLEISGTANSAPTNVNAAEAWFVPGSTHQTSASSATTNVSLYASAYLASGAGIVAHSDARLKNVSGISDKTNDLQTLNKIVITDYTMRNKSEDDQSYKKVIAQQVQSVYPQAVKKTGEERFIANLYQLVKSFEVNGNTITMQLSKPIEEKDAKDIVAGAAIKFYLTENADAKNMKEMEGIIIAINGTTLTVTINEELNASYNQLFAFGTKVSNILSVDYDAISMLNVSATQELYKMITDLKAENQKLKAENASVIKTNEAMLNDIQRIKVQLGMDVKAEK